MLLFKNEVFLDLHDYRIKRRNMTMVSSLVDALKKESKEKSI